MIKKHNMGWAWLSLVMFGILDISIKLQATWISWFDDLGANLMPRVTWANSTSFETITNLGNYHQSWQSDSQPLDSRPGWRLYLAGV